jgi:hypothetical protein
MRINLLNLWGLKLILQIADKDKNEDIVLIGVDVIADNETKEQKK